MKSSIQRVFHIIEEHGELNHAQLIPKCTVLDLNSGPEFLMTTVLYIVYAFDFSNLIDNLNG